MLPIVIILILRVIQHLFEKLSSNGIPNTVASLKYISIRQAASSIFALILVSLTTNLATIRLDFLTALLAGFMAISLAFCTYAGLMALKNGTMVLASLFSMAGVFVPCIASAFLFDEPLEIMQIVGLVVFLYAAYLLIGCSKEIYCKFAMKELGFLILSMISNGCIMLAQKMFTFYVPDGNAGVFNFLAFTLSAIFSLVLFWGVRKQEIKTGNVQETKIQPCIMVYGFVLAATILFISQISTVATANIPSVVLFPVSDGGGMLICAVVSAVVFHEKLSIKSIAGLALGTISLIIIGS